jgi:hypothetical protein
MHREHYAWTQPHAVTVPDLEGQDTGGGHVALVVAWDDDPGADVIDDSPIHGRSVADYLED